MNTLIDATKVTFKDGCLHVELPGRVVLSFPIAGNWRLERATHEQLSNVEVDDDGLHWPDIDEDLSFAGIIRGDWGQHLHQLRH